MADFGIHELDRLLSQATASVQAARAPGPVDLAAIAVGEAADGQVRATVRGGRLDAVTIEPQVARLPHDELARHIVTAVNAALDAQQRGTPPPGEVDPAALTAQLRDLQDQSLRQMSAFTGTMNDVLARLRADRG
jgi:hypothetical protein